MERTQEKRVRSTTFLQCHRSKGAITMSTTFTHAAEYRDLPLSLLTASTTNPRRIFEDDALKELADYVPRHIIGILCR
jgi:hypothetical protein